MKIIHDAVYIGSKKLSIKKGGTEFFIAYDSYRNAFAIESWDGNIKTNALVYPWIDLTDFASPIQAYRFLKDNFENIY